LVQAVLQPLLAMIDAWMTDGRLQDPYHEFFVLCDPTVPLKDLWTKMYTLDPQMVPCFMPMPVAMKVLRTGKSVNFIRQCCEETDWILPPKDGEDTSRPVAVSSVANLENAVDLAWRRTSKQLVSLLMDKYKTLDHALAIRRYLLLAQGDFVQCLIDLATKELSQDAGEVYRHNMISLVDHAVRQSNAQYHDTEMLERLDVKILTPSQGEVGWDVFQLDYAVTPPIDVVFTPDAMRQYHRAFSFLWRLRRVSHSLSQCWGDQVAFNHQLRRQSISVRQMGTIQMTLHSCYLLRNEMLHWIQNLQSYVLYEVLEHSWQGFTSSSFVDLDAIVASHEVYLTRLQEGAFLTPKRSLLLAAIHRLLDLVMTFVATQENIHASITAEHMAPAGSGVFDTDRATLLERYSIDQLSSAFTQQIGELLLALDAVTPGHGPELRYLSCRLDYNEFYSVTASRRRRRTRMSRPPPATE